MATPFRITPSLGPDLSQKFTAGAFYDSAGATAPSYQLGSVVRGSDGGEYMFVKASGTIAATPTTGTQVAVTYATKTVATGTGGWYTHPDVAAAADDYIHVRRGAFNATPA